MSSGLYVSKTFKPIMGGGEQSVHQLTRHLNELGERVTVVTPSRPAHADVDTAFDESCGYPVERFDSTIGSGKWLTRDFHRRGLFEIAGAARRASADYMLLNTTVGTLDLATFLASKLTRTPLFTVTHDVMDSPMPWRAVDDLVFRMASGNVCVSDFTAGLVEARGVDPRKIHVIPDGVDLPEVDASRRRAGTSARVEAAFSAGGPFVLTVARLNRSKGIQTVIAAMPRIVSEAPGTRYVIVGGGAHGDDAVHGEELRQLGAESPVADAITFLGPLPDDEKFDCFRRCDVYAQPSFNEWLGTTYLEAGAFGKPVVGSRLDGIPEAVTDGETGLLVDPHSESEVANAIIRLLKKPEEARRFGENGRRRVENGFTWRRSAEKLLSVIRGVVEEPRR